MVKEDKDRLFKLLDLFSTIKDSGDCLLSNYRKIMKDDTLLPNYEKVLESDYINTKNNIVNSIVNTICNSIVLNDELLKGDVISKHLTENILSIDKNDLLNKSNPLPGMRIGNYSKNTLIPSSVVEGNLMRHIHQGWDWNILTNINSKISWFRTSL